MSDKQQERRLFRIDDHMVGTPLLVFNGKARFPAVVMNGVNSGTARVVFSTVTGIQETHRKASYTLPVQAEVLENVGGLEVIATGMCEQINSGCRQMIRAIEELQQHAEAYAAAGFDLKDYLPRYQVLHR
ncbi:hypothetical protein KY320_01950 [Candidatus Woesearchaeota archaeon]|nr:hypothetical protein [Candidatus Woesearchaeota archaeon]